MVSDIPRVHVRRRRPLPLLCLHFHPLSGLCQFGRARGLEKKVPGYGGLSIFEAARFSYRKFYHHSCICWHAASMRESEEIQRVTFFYSACNVRDIYWLSSSDLFLFSLLALSSASLKLTTVYFRNSYIYSFSPLLRSLGISDRQDTSGLRKYSRQKEGASCDPYCQHLRTLIASGHTLTLSVPHALSSSLPKWDFWRRAMGTSRNSSLTKMRGALTVERAWKKKRASLNLPRLFEGVEKERTESEQEIERSKMRKYYFSQRYQTMIIRRIEFRLYRISEITGSMRKWAEKRWFRN